MSAKTPSLSDHLAEFALSNEPIPESAERAVRMTTANVLGLIVGASGAPACRMVWDAVSAAELPPQATVLGRSRRTSVMAAALVGGTAAHLEDFDDTHLQTVIHPGAPVVPAAFAVAEQLGKTYGELLEAVARGVEVTLRVGIGLGQWHFDRGWHITGTTGRFGATAAAARLLGLDAKQVAHAIGIAATEAAGIQVAFGTMTKPFHAGKAAYDGVEAAYLAREGFTSGAHALEGARGLFATASRQAETARVLEGLGDHWEIEHNAIKPYACGIVSHPVIDAGIELRRRGLQPEWIREVMLRTNPVVLDVMGKSEPQSGLETKFSVYHCFAIGVACGAGGPAQFSDEAAHDPLLEALRRSIKVAVDPLVARDACEAEVLDRSGRVWRQTVEHATASEDRPMTESELREKIEQLAFPVLSTERARDFAQTVLRAAGTTPVAEIAGIGTAEGAE